MPKRVLIVAHYHPEGRLRDDTRALLQHAAYCFHKVLLVSTGLDHATIQGSLPAEVEIIVRPNVGYDFFSYRTGLLLIKDFPGLSEVVIMNDSIYIHDPYLFAAQCMGPLPLTTDFAALTQCFEVAPHGQSFFMIFRLPCLQRETFWQWWHEQQPLTEKPDIVLKQEIGLSQFLLARGFSFSVLFHPNCLCHYALPGKASFPVILPAREREVLMVLNPTHFFWPELLKRYGFIKMEVLRDNPYQFDIPAELSHFPGVAQLKGLFKA